MILVMSGLRIRHGLLPVGAGVSVDQASVSPDRHGFVAADLVIRHGRIVAPGHATHPADLALDASGCFVLPGFVDLHIHGSAGADLMDASGDALATIARFAATHGVTSLLATTMTAPHEATLAAVRTVAAHAPQLHGGARILGVHLEGPYISPRFPGAQPAQFIRPPDLDEFAELATNGPVRMITLAPEVPGTEQLIKMARRLGVTVVLGHTNATYEECVRAVELGVTQATHTYNAMSGLHHRRPGALGATLSLDAIDAQLIADNIHVHPAGINILARCKGVERTILITDAIRATGLGPGQYELGGQPVTVRNGECRLADGTLAGSILTMDRALVNFMAATGITLAEAWPVTSHTPARSIGLGDEIGALTPGYRGDLVLLDERFEVVATVVGGEVVYLRERETGRLLDKGKS
jgi:N-acetylglucosamine-6-phosphate deacetylase